MQQQQAAQATAANQQRTARLNYGSNLIQNMFEGTPTGATPLDLSSITPANLSSGAQNKRTSLSNGYSWGALPDTGGAQAYGIYDASGNLVTSADSIADLAASKINVGGDPNKTTGGFTDDFYNKYRQSIMDYYLPQEGKQYADARSSLAYSLARAGQLESSTATKDIADLSSQDAINRAQTPRPARFARTSSRTSRARSISSTRPRTRASPPTPPATWSPARS
jgi:hypothetical protein